MQRVIPAKRIATVLNPPLKGGADPTYLQLSRGLSSAISDGRIEAGARLPSERELTRAMPLSRTTVTRAYADLRERGYLATRRGSGSVVQLPNVPGGRIDHLLAPAGLQSPDSDLIDLSCTAPLGNSGLAAVYAAALTRLDAYLPGSGYFPSGLPVLREQIAAWHRRRGLPTTADQILVTTGALSAVTLALRTVLGAGDRVVLESPTYPNVIGSLQGTTARLVAHPLDQSRPGDEWDPDGFDTLLRQIGARAAYLIPDFHNPTGMLMDAQQRSRIGASLRRNRVVPVIDESLAELALEPDIAMPDSLAVHVPDAIVVGGLSKTFWGGLRVGWLRAPQGLIAELVRQRLRYDLGVPVLEQLVATDLLQHGRDLADANLQALRLGRSRMLAQLAEHLPDWRMRAPVGGLSVWCELPETGATALAAAADRHGLRLVPGPVFAPGGGLDRWLRIPFLLPPGRVDQVCPRLARAWTEVVSAPKSAISLRADMQPLIA